MAKWLKIEVGIGAGTLKMSFFYELWSTGKLVCLPLSVSIVSFMPSPLCLPLIISAVLLPPLTSPVPRLVISVCVFSLFLLCVGPLFLLECCPCSFQSSLMFLDVLCVSLYLFLIQLLFIKARIFLFPLILPPVWSAFGFTFWFFPLKTHRDRQSTFTEVMF